MHFLSQLGRLAACVCLVAASGCAMPAADEGAPAEADIGQSDDALSLGSVMFGNVWSQGCLTVVPATGAVEDRACERDANGHSTNANQRFVLIAADNGTVNIRWGSTWCLGLAANTYAFGNCSPYFLGSPNLERKFQQFAIPGLAARNDNNSFLIRSVSSAGTTCMAEQFSTSAGPVYGKLVKGTCPAGPSRNNPNELSADGTRSFGWVAEGI
jgi:hypothetical protein